MTPNLRQNGEATDLSLVPQEISGRGELALGSVILLPEDRTTVTLSCRLWSWPRKVRLRRRLWGLPCTLDLVEWSIVCPVPVPLIPGFGQANPVGKSTCHLVQKLL